MKKVISILLIALSFGSTAALAEIKFRKGERLNIEEKAAPKAYWSGKYLLRQGVRTEIKPTEKSIHKDYYSGDYRMRRGERTLLSKS